MRLTALVAALHHGPVGRAHTWLRQLWSPRFVSFALVGASGVFVNLGGLFILADVLHLNLELSSASAIEVSIIWNFLLNNSLTFRDKNADAHAGFLLRMVQYNLVGLVGLGLQLATFVLANAAITHLLGLSEPGLFKYPSQMLGIGLGMAWNFFSNFHWTWRQKAELSTQEQDNLQGDEA